MPRNIQMKNQKKDETALWRLILPSAMKSPPMGDIDHGDEDQEKRHGSGLHQGGQVSFHILEELDPFGCLGSLYLA